MNLKDARHLSASAKEALLYPVANEIKNGMSKLEVSLRVSGVAQGNTQLNKSYSNRRLKGIESEKTWTSSLQLAAAARSSSFLSTANGAVVSRSIRFTVLFMGS